MDETKSTTTDQLTGLSRCLVMDGVFDHESALEHQQKADEATLPLISYLVENKIVNSLTIASAASREFGIPFFDLEAMDMEMAPIELVSETLIRKHNLLPLYKRGNRLFVAVSDPLNLGALDEIKFHADAHIQAILVEEDKLRTTIQKTLEAMDTSMAGLDDEELDDLDISSSHEESDEDLSENEINDTPIVRFVNKILLDAINKNASDLHFEPFEKFYRIRYRVDGILIEAAAPPVSLTLKIAARIKVMSQLDVSERRVPQDGRMRMVLSKHRAIDFRVSTCPTLFGEKIVMRILDPSSAQLGIDALGYEEDQKTLYLNALKKPSGMILVTGPTGSGKTVSLYTGLNILNTEERNISTAEDPAEINLPGINQVNVRPKVGLTFSAALKSFLRQDPDIIMVGEIRDLETAEIAIKAAQTGHMVLSTLHTNDAPQTLTRLLNMGVAPFNVASSVSLIIAQRLARRLCTHCKQVIDIPKEALLKEGFEEGTLEELAIYGAVGCDQCHQGYKGRVGIYQVMPVSETMSKLIMEGGNALQLAELSKKEGVADLRMSGLKKVLQGLTTLDEINRVITS
ncbi:MAG TPA: type IV-A pilus assembly ATPase PilB [Gammaproteobacteria bacterium]|nr:type IV-A pilus assembly ATPase PilB [Gammaproteobacteria bacterium]